MILYEGQVSSLNEFKTEFTNEEKVELEKCFKKIQDFIKVNYMENGSSKGVVELRLHYNPYTHSYLVINFNTSEVYLSHRNHACSQDNYFCKNQSEFSTWKYTLCMIVIEKWKDIKEALNEYFINDKNVYELCNSFQI